MRDLRVAARAVGSLNPAIVVLASLDDLHVLAETQFADELLRLFAEWLSAVTTEFWAVDIGKPDTLLDITRKQHVDRIAVYDSYDFAADRSVWLNSNG